MTVDVLVWAADGPVVVSHSVEEWERLIEGVDLEASFALAVEDAPQIEDDAA